jgi:hypothetical protein
MLDTLAFLLMLACLPLAWRMIHARPPDAA